MTTLMHRLQISLPQWEMQFLQMRAQRDGLSIAEVIRQLVQREAEAVAPTNASQSLWEIAGMATDSHPLQNDVPVSERPERYLAALSASSVRKRRKATRRPRTTRAEKKR